MSTFLELSAVIKLRKKSYFFEKLKFCWIFRDGKDKKNPVFFWKIKNFDGNLIVAKIRKKQFYQGFQGNTF